MARDCKLDIFVAIKIYKSSPFYQECAMLECKTLLAMNKAKEGDELFDFLKKRINTESKEINTVRLLNCFSHSAANGTHFCLVLELLGPSLETILHQYKDLVN